MEEQQPDNASREHRFADDFLGKGILVAALFGLIIYLIVSCAS